MILKKYPFVKQKENKDCGVCCLSMIIKYYGGLVSEDVLYDITKTTKSGTSAYNLIEAATTLGFKAGGIKSSLSELECTLPCIAHVMLEEKYGHYVVIYEINRKKEEVYIADPANKKIKISFNEFNTIFKGIIITLTLEKKLPIYENKITIKNYIRELIYTYKKDWIYIYLKSLILLILSFILSLSLVFMLKARDNNQIINILIIFVFIGILKNILNYIQYRAIYRINHKIDNQLMIKAIKNIILLPYQFYCNRSTGEITKRIQDLESVGQNITQIIVIISTSSLMAIMAAIILYILNLKMFIISIVWILFYILVIYIFKKPLKDKINYVKQKASNMYTKLIESIEGFETIKGLILEERQINNLSQNYIDYNKSIYEFELLNEKQKFTKNIINEIGYIVLYGIGCIQILNGNLKLTELLIFQTLFMYLLFPIEKILEMNVSLYDMEKSLQRGLELLYVSDEKQKLKCRKIQSIELKRLSYERNESVLKNINLKIKLGQKILIMGPSGSGKSTLLKIIRGYYPISNGKVYINGIDLNLYTKESISKKITYISQNEIIFTNTLYDNLKLQRNVSDKEIIKQIKDIKLEKVIQNKKIGLQELIEENGNNLSGGERQRIILVRSLLKKSDVILIDEGFSQMDSSLERTILKNIFKNNKNKTIIVVSHRKDNIDLYDTYIELCNGKIKKHLIKSC